MLPKLDTIAAIATAHGRGGIGVVRVSGRNLSTFVEGITQQALSPRHAKLTPFLDVEGTPIDTGVAIFFPGPSSYTGEDVLELQGHGGTAVLQLVLQRCLDLGARLAEPGEFTLRAFLNNKIDLIQAEAISDLIEATSEQAALSASRSMQGEFSLAITDLVSRLIDLRMLVEATLDFPEEELDLADLKRRDDKLNDITTQLDQIFNLAQQGSILREGAHIVLVGAPNVGKSSLLNRLSGEDVALVSDVAGTTRDTIKQAINIDGVPLHIIDTAGLRESSDVVEQMGIARTKLAMQKADAVLVLADAQGLDEQLPSEAYSFVSEKTPKLFVINKIDLISQPARIETQGSDSKIYISAKNNTGIDLLKSKILELVDWHGESGVFMARERHLRALSVVREHLGHAKNQASHMEFYAEELRLAQEALSSLTGEFTSDDLLGEIFSRFCIGK